MRYRVYIASPAERDAVVSILAHNGYTVRQGKEKQGSRSVSFVEFWKEGATLENQC